MRSTEKAPFKDPQGSFRQRDLDWSEAMVQGWRVA